MHYHRSIGSTVSIIDYSMANLRSVQKAFEHNGAGACIISTPEEVRRADRIVLPGVGAIGDALKTLRGRGLDDAICEHIASGRPFLGICLGLQMLFDVGYEDGEHIGLGICRGKCVRLEVDVTHALKVPHMGWNQLRIKSESPLLRGIDDGCHVYFVHGYHVVPDDDVIIATTTDYGVSIISSIWKDNVMATQFHPEKSQVVGLKMLDNFARF